MDVEMIAPKPSPILYAAGIASLAQMLLGGADGLDLQNLGAALIQTGGPTALGALVAQSAVPKAKGLELAAVSGVTAFGLLVISGAMPLELDVGSLLYVALVGGSVVAGQKLASK